MPFLDSRKRDFCRTEAIEAISMIESIITDHPNHLFIIGGDLNCELKGGSPFDHLWNNFCTKYQLAYCSNHFSSPGYIYCHETLDQKKLNDHFIISQSIMNKGICSDFKITEDGHNPSDHLPISFSIQLTLQQNEIEPNESDRPRQVQWYKISDKVRQLYADRLANFLEFSPIDWICESGCHCENDICESFIQAEYDHIISCLIKADKILPRHHKGSERDWWTPELSILKQQSIDIQCLWLSEGRPRSGPTCFERLKVRAAYRRAIRSAQTAPKQNSRDQMHTAMGECDSGNFWRSWKTLYNKNNNSFAPVVEGCTSKPAIAAFKNAFSRNSQPNNRDNVDSLNQTFATKYAEYSQTHNDSCTCEEHKVSVNIVIDAISAMKQGKCADEYGINPEHFHYAPLILFQR